MSVDTVAKHAVTRIRRERRRRTLTVAASERLSPSMLRLRFSSPDLSDFESAAPDDHIKLFVPDGQGGMAMRDYTPRGFDTQAQTLVIDFALHDAGPATAWAASAQVGDQVQIGGPQGSTIVTDDFDWYLLMGDETALPAIARRVEELRPGVPIIVLVAVDSTADRIALQSRPGLDVSWSYRSDGRDDAALLIARLETLTPLAGDGYVWIAGEASVVRSLREQVLNGMNHPREWVKAAGYWTRGLADTHGSIID